MFRHITLICLFFSLALFVVVKLPEIALMIGSLGILYGVSVIIYDLINNDDDNFTW